MLLEQETWCFWIPRQPAGYTSGAFGPYGGLYTWCFRDLWQAIHLVLLGPTVGYTSGAFGTFGRLYT